MKYIVILLVFYFNLFAENISVESFNNLKVLKEKGIKVNEFKKYDSIYLLKGVRDTKRGQIPILFYMTKDLKYTFFGRGFDNQDQALYIAKDMGKYDRYANFTYGEGKDKYYLFIDPQCPYCKQFEKILSSKKDIKNKVKIYYFLYPLSFHKEAVPMSNYILSKEDRLKAMQELMIKGSSQYKTFSNQKRKELEENDKIAFEIGVRGTPSLFDSRGKPLNYMEFLKNLR